MTGKLSDYMLVGLDVMACGNGIQTIELLQMGASLQNEQRFFYPMSLKRVHIDPDLLAAQGFNRQEFVDTKTRHREPLLSQSKGVETLLTNLKYALGRTRSDGIVLVTLHMESLLALVRCIINTESRDCKADFLKIVKSYCILEPVIRVNCLIHCPDGARIDQAMAAKLFGLEVPATAEEMAVNTLRMAKWMMARHWLADSCRDLSYSLFQRIQEVHQQLVAYGPVREQLLRRDSLAEVRDLSNRNFTALINPFPKPVQLSSVPETATALLLQVLVYTKYDLPRLTVMCQSYDLSKTEERLQRILEETLGPLARRDDMSLLKDLLRLLIKNVSALSASSPSTSGNNRPCHRFDEGSPASSTYDSEGSMPEDTRGGRQPPSSPLKSRDMAELQEDLCRQFKAQKGRAAALGRVALDQISTLMCQAWETVNLPFPQLRHHFSDAGSSAEQRADKAIKLLRQHFGDSPLDWKGLTILDLVQATGDYIRRRAQFADPEMAGLEKSFVEAVAEARGIRAGASVPPELRAVARSLTFVLEEASFTYKRLTGMVPASGASEMTRGHLAHAIRKQCGLDSDQLPNSWDGFNIDFIVRVVCNHFEECSRRANDERRPGSDPIRKRKHEEAVNGQPVKKLRPEEEERWQRLERSIKPENLLRGLLNFCSRKKVEHHMFAELDDQRIILQLVGLTEKRKLGLATMQENMAAHGADNTGKERELAKAVKILFDEGGSSRQDRGYESDFIMLRALYERFCSYQIHPATLAEDLAPPVPSPAAPEEPGWVENVESMQQVIDILRQRYEKLGFRYKDQASQELHEHLFYSQKLRQVVSSKSTALNKEMARLAKNVVRHITGEVKNIATLIKDYEEQKRGGVNQHQLSRWLDQQLAKNKLPPDCATKAGLLVCIIKEHLDHMTNARPISQKVVDLKMELDMSNGLTDLQNYLFHCYAESATVMAVNGDLVGFTLDDIDIGRLSPAVHKTVNFLLEVGFNLYEAVERYIQGQLVDVLNNLLRPHEAVNPEAVDHGLLTRLCLDFIESRVKRYRPRSLPQSRAHWQALQRRVAALIRNGYFLKPHRMEAVKVRVLYCTVYGTYQEGIV